MSLLEVDWCDHEAARYACKHWHYSGSLSSASNVYLGVWEHGFFCGVVVFGIGAGNVTNGRRFGLKRSGEMAELTRIALRAHATHVSRIVSVALRMLKKQSPGLRLVISLADPMQGHVGGIYQAGNWIYAGRTKPDVQYLLHGKWVHHRTATSSTSAKGLPSRPLLPKHRYLMPLDDAMRQRIQPLRQPYPKRVKSETGDTAGVQLAEGGSTPTLTLQCG